MMKSAIVDIPEGFRKCSRCSIVLPNDQFISNRSKENTLTKQCMRCREIQVKSDQRKRKRNKETIVDIPEGFRRCSQWSCSKVLLNDQFISDTFFNGYFGGGDCSIDDLNHYQL